MEPSGGSHIRNKINPDIIVITGASGEIGSHICEHYLNQNKIVIGCSRSTIHFESPNFYFYSCDVSNHGSVREITSKIIEKFHNIHILINCAGVMYFNDFLDITENEFINSMSVNVKGALFFSQSVLPSMIKQKKGYIINIGSTRAITGASNKATYSASKFALRGLTQSLSAEFFKHGIRASLICPGFVLTKKNRDLYEKYNLSADKIVKKEDITKTIDYILKLSPGAYIREIILGGML